MTNGRRRVLVPQALGGDEYLRATWHENQQVVVFSQWSNERCTAAIPVRIEHLGELASLLVESIGVTLARTATIWPAPDPAGRVELSAAQIVA